MLSHSKKVILRRQRDWARSAGLEPDARGYLGHRDRNLRAPMSAATLLDFETGGGGELLPRPSGPPKLQALHSSAALVVNVFDYWRERDAAPLLSALGIEGELSAMSFEKQLPTGLAGKPPNVDVALMLVSGHVAGIESKFTEWLTAKPGNKPAFKDKYFADGVKRWTNNGLPACQQLASDLLQRRQRFRLLDAAQLLKHALGLSANHPGAFSLHYLFHDTDCPQGAQHRQEIAEFSERVGAELRFSALSYQDLYRAMHTLPRTDPEYLKYLGTRYFNP